MSADPDVRGFYAALGIELPGWAGRNVSVRCFADPDSHAHGDRTPSCSVSTEHGAWKCWSCGASGGPYDAALALGHTPASALDLKVKHGLAERSDSNAPTARRQHSPARAKPATPHPTARPPALAASEDDVTRWQEALFSDGRRGWREHLADRRLWSEAAMRELELGCDRGRITIPIRNADGQLRGVLRYLPGANPKMRAVPGTRLGLIPHPAREPSGRILLVEGPADMIAARSRGWPAVAVPGDQAWRPEWAQLLKGGNVTIAMDCDDAGRAAARRIADDLRGICLYRIADLATDRSDGFDLTDWLLQQRQPRRTPCAPCSSSRLTITR